MFYWKRGPEPGRMGASITIMSILSDRLSEEILQARQRVYTVGEPTPLQRLNLPGIKAPVYAKREDLGPIRAYKWRGAFNCMAALSQEARDKGIVAASAGNHAQGVALAASVLNCHATIFMPRSTPEVKQTEVRRHGGRHVKIMLHGDCYDETAAAAHEYAETHGSTFVHPYDDLVTMAGQGTLADEVVMSGEGPFDRAYVAIGGGGLAASVACWLKKFWPHIKDIGVEGVDQVRKVIHVDQNPIGRTPRSNPATYTGVWDKIRTLFAKTPEAQVRGYGPGRFSFNVKGGRCEACHGDGTLKIEMNFLPDVYVDCEVCHGKRYNRETLEVTYNGKTVADILNMPIEEAADFFKAYTGISRYLKTLVDVGLGYIRLGQPAPTLSGGDRSASSLPPSCSADPTAKPCTSSTSRPPACTSKT